MKVIPQPLGLPRFHRIVVVVEVKRNEDVSESGALTQTIDYLQRAYEQPSSHDNELRAFLVMGRMVHSIWMENGLAVVGDTFDMFAAGDRFTTELAGIAIHNWN